MKHIFSLAMAIFLAGCASVKVSGPGNYQIDRSRTYHASFEKSWDRAVDWFADNNVAIEKIEKGSGLITAKHLVRVGESFLDCGKIEVNGTLGAARVDRYVSLNVTVRSVSASETKVNVNVFGEYTVEGNDKWDGRAFKTGGHCVSTGNIEKEILAFVAQGMN